MSEVQWFKGFIYFSALSLPWLSEKNFQWLLLGTCRVIRLVWLSGLTSALPFLFPCLVQIMDCLLPCQGTLSKTAFLYQYILSNLITQSCSCLPIAAELPSTFASFHFLLPVDFLALIKRFKASVRMEFGNVVCLVFEWCFFTLPKLRT